MLQIQLFPLFLAFFGLILATQVSQNIVFREISEVTSTRSRWTITFVIDLNLYVSVMGNIEENIRHILGVIRTITENHFPGTNGLVNDFQD